jgi:hypothetical protein
LWAAWHGTGIADAMQADPRKLPRRKRATSKAQEGWTATRERRGVIEQAASDVRRGLEDTDRRARRKPKPV